MFLNIPLLQHTSDRLVSQLDSPVGQDVLYEMLLSGFDDNVYILYSPCLMSLGAHLVMFAESFAKAPDQSFYVITFLGMLAFCLA